MVVVFHSCQTSREVRRHEQLTQMAIAERLARVLECEFGGEFEPARAYADALYFVPSDPLTTDQARRLSIRAPNDLFGGVVPFPFVATKAITHALQGAGAAAPPGWSATFAEQVRDVVLPGFTAFSIGDARAAGRQLLRDGPVRLKPVEGIGGSGQQAVGDASALDAALDALDSGTLSRTGIVIEANLTEVVTYSVGQLQVGAVLASYWGVQRLTANNHGVEVYGGSSLTVVRGGFDTLLALPLAAPVRTAIEQACAYHDAALASFAGMFVSRSNYDVAQGVDGRGRWRSGVLEQSWRIGGASGAEVAALQAFAADPALRVVRAATTEIYGGTAAVPADATVYFDGVDEHAGRITKYARLEPHVHP